MFKTHLAPCSEKVAETLAEAGRLYHESAGAIKNRPEVERAEAQERLGPHVRACVGGVLAQSGGDKWAGARARAGAEDVLGEQRGQECASAAGSTRTALPSEAVQEDRGQRGVDAYRVLPGSGHSPSRRCAGSSIAAAERSQETRPRPKRPARARSVEAPDKDAREVERLARRVEQHSQRMAELLRRGALEPSMAYAFLMTKGERQCHRLNPRSKLGRETERRRMKELKLLLKCPRRVHRQRGRSWCL